MDSTVNPTATICHDDPAIGDSERLWRLVGTVADPAVPGGMRPESGSLRDERMSVNRAKLSTLEETLSLQPDREIAEFTAASVRELGLRVYADPCYVCRQCGRHLGNEPSTCPSCNSDARIYRNMAHAIVCPAMSKSAARRFAKEKTELVEITREVRASARQVR